MSSPTFKLAFDYDATALSSVKQFNVYVITNGARSASPVASTTSVPTDTNPLVIAGSFGKNEVEVVPVGLDGTEDTLTAFFTAICHLPAPTNLRQIS